MKANLSNLQYNQAEKLLIKRLLHACIHECLLPFVYTDNSLSIPLKRNNKTIIVKNVQCYALRKFKLYGDVILTEKNNIQILENIPQLLNLIHYELESILDLKQWKQFITEINNCVVNDRLVLSSVNDSNNTLSESIKRSKHHRLIDYIRTHYLLDEQLKFFERWAIKGHPYHPCHKTKLGFSKKAYLKFSPEFNKDIKLPLAAIEKSLLHVEGEEANFNYHEWFAVQFPEQWDAWVEAVKMQEISKDNFYPMFIHPWQYDNVLQDIFSDHILNKKIILFSNIFIITKASLSFRTLIAKENPRQPHIKLPVAIQSTSAIRTVSPASVQNGPKLGKILRKILDVENHFNKTLKFSYEVCGLHIKDNPDIAKNLSIIYRQNPSTLIDRSQLPIVVAALFVESPVNNLPLFIELIEASTDGSLDAVADYFNQYSRIVINAFFDLFLVYGIALEGHQQNTIAVFENYKPVYMIARDLGGTKVDLTYLKSRGYHLKPYPKSAIIAEDRAEVTNNFLHTVLQYHLGEIVLLLAEHYHVSEKIFWKLIKNHLQERFDILGEKVPAAHWEIERKAILENDWKIKNLMRMRLKNTCYNYIFTDIPNPLREV